MAPRQATQPARRRSQPTGLCGRMESEPEITVSAKPRKKSHRVPGHIRIAPVASEAKPTISFALESFVGDSCIDLMADGAHRVLRFRVEISGVVAVHVIAGCPGGQSRKNVLARGGVYVLIHRMNTN